MQWLITGGARSGKSTYAEQLAKDNGQQVGYIATALPIDSDMADRIKKHQSSRPSHWHTFECYKDFALLTKDPAFTTCDCFLLDCVTILITNLMFDVPLDYDTCTMEEVAEVETRIHQVIDVLVELMKANDKTLILVTNEVGLGLVPPYRLGNLFRDIAGRVNQRLAKSSDHVTMIVSGLPLTLK